MVLTELSRWRPSSAVALPLVSLSIVASLFVSYACPDNEYRSDEEIVVEEGYKNLWKSPPDVLASLASFKRALRINPASPLRWEDLGNTFLLAGRTDDADYCYERATHLGPHVPAVQLRLANFAMQTGQSRRALMAMHSVLEQTAAYDQIVFSYYNRLGLDISDILQNGIPNTPRAAGAFLLNSLAQRDKVKTCSIWNWASSRGLIRDDVADAYAREIRSRLITGDCSQRLGGRAEK